MDAIEKRAREVEESLKADVRFQHLTVMPSIWKRRKGGWPYPKWAVGEGNLSDISQSAWEAIIINGLIQIKG